MTEIFVAQLIGYVLQGMGGILDQVFRTLHFYSGHQLGVAPFGLSTEETAQVSVVQVKLSRDGRKASD